MRHLKKYQLHFPFSGGRNLVPEMAYSHATYNPPSCGNNAMNVHFRRCQTHYKYPATGKKRTF